MDWEQGLMVVDIVDACPSGVRRRLDCNLMLHFLRVGGTHVHGK